MKIINYKLNVQIKMQDLNPKKKNKKSQYNKFTGDNIAILHSIRSYSIYNMLK